VIVNDSTNIIKTNYYLLPQIIEHKQTTSIDKISVFKHHAVIKALITFRL